MSERDDLGDLPQARLTPGRRTRISVIWIIPILAAVVAIGIAVNRILQEGPTITIDFASAEGVEAGKTFIKYKDVKIGQVTKVQLSDDYSKVRVTAKIAKEAGRLMVEDARFWLVEPRVTLSGVSGLGTLLSGDYIGFETGRSTKQARKFTALEVAPVVMAGQRGREFMLTANALGSVSVGSPIYYRRMQAGQVTAFRLAPDGKSIEIGIFVNAPYDQYVSTATRFWNASGIDVSLNANGFDVRTESLVALLVGGVAFETPAFAAAGAPAAAGAKFALYGDRTTAMRQPDAIARHFVLYFDESLRGVSVGAPVLLLGLPAGEVTDVGVEINPAAPRPLGRIEIVAYPDRLLRRISGTNAAEAEGVMRGTEQRQAFLERLVEKQGLRAQLQSGSILTGERFVALDFFPTAKKASIDWTVDKPVVPTIPSTLPDLEGKLSGILAKLDGIPYDAIGKDLKTTLGSLNKLLLDADAHLTPEIKATLVDLRGTLAKADRLMQNTDATMLGPDAPTQQALREALQEISGAARSLRVLTDYLERHPDALLKGKDEEKP